MTVTRRVFLQAGGAIFAGLHLSDAWAGADGVAEIVMRGNADGSDVWFDPIGLLLRPGETVRWTNRDAGNSHTTAAYHPANDGHPLRIPPGAAPWSSDYLLPNESFSLQLHIEGVYDYYCIPHEHAGMAGRIVVLARGRRPPPEPGVARLPEAIRRNLPSVEEIVRETPVARPAR